MLLDGGTENGERILDARTVAQMTSPSRLPSETSRGLGWDIDSPYSAGMNAVFGPHSFGHTGYTGTSIWLDPNNQSFLIILTSRLYPNDGGDAKLLRTKVARAAFAIIHHHPLPQ
jgi:CubicO group peptidase (beta-lactamase class C family)